MKVAVGGYGCGGGCEGDGAAGVVVVDNIKATTATINTTTNTDNTNKTMHAKRKFVMIITATLTRAISTKTIPRSPSIPYHHHNHHYNPITTMTRQKLIYSTLTSIT